MKTTIDFRILDFDCHPDEISSKIGITPTRTWLRGTLINPKGTVLHKENGWELRVLLPEEIDFVPQLEFLIELLEPKLEAIADMVQHHTCELSCALYLSSDSNQSTPWVHFSKEAVRILNKIGCEIDFDIYLIE